MNSDPQDWYEVSNVAGIESPGLLFYIERIEENITRMIGIAGGAERLRPHLKTHKTRELLQMQMNRGIRKFKCATIAEAELAATVGVPDLFLAYQPVGPNVARLLELVQKYLLTRFSALFDNRRAAQQLSDAAAKRGVKLPVYLDVDVGQHRSGISPDHEALSLYVSATKLPGLLVEGLHGYDGHISDADVTERKRKCEEAFTELRVLGKMIDAAGLPAPKIIAGGTPTFPFHAQRGDVDCSPGTCVLWDHGYGSKLPDMNFLPAALVITRVVSKPKANRLCVDLGHKAVAAESPQPRVFFPALPEVKIVVHSEEHLVLETDRAAEFEVGTVLYGIPWHICPTVALHSHATVVRQGRAGERWAIAARDRKLTV
ncbi:MAG: family PLP-dependent enzyme [Verrucomicrobiales bacterium]|nr:family PLP-dependent enzyme [Verrucomicrobiales bacterium]